MTRTGFGCRPAGGAAAAVVAAAFVVGAMVTPADAQEKVQWRVPIGFASTLPALGDNAPWVAEQLEAASGGNIRLRIEEPGKIVPAFQIMEAVKDKKVPAGYTWVGYDQGKIPALPLIAAVPFGMEPWEFNAWWYYGGGQQLGEELYAPHNIHPILCGIISPETAGWFKFEIQSLDDVKGLKIRFAGLGGRVMEKLGASVTMIPGGEIFQALEKGTIDASEFSLPEVDEKLGFHQVVKNNYFPGWHQPFTSLHLIVKQGRVERPAAGVAGVDQPGVHGGRDQRAVQVRAQPRGHHGRLPRKGRDAAQAAGTSAARALQDQPGSDCGRSRQGRDVQEDPGVADRVPGPVRHLEEVRLPAARLLRFGQRTIGVVVVRRRSR
ncbi:MAG: TRAP transporter substrate-binding protein [Rhodospirillales bacterium]